MTPFEDSGTGGRSPAEALRELLRVLTYTKGEWTKLLRAEKETGRALTAGVPEETAKDNKLPPKVTRAVLVTKRRGAGMGGAGAVKVS